MTPTQLSGPPRRRRASPPSARPRAPAAAIACWPALPAPRRPRSRPAPPPRTRPRPRRRRRPGRCRRVAPAPPPASWLQRLHRSGTTAACDLYAMTGTTSVLGTPIPIWGFSTTGAAGSATAPGPGAGRRTQGDTVTITLHNQLAARRVSLALPGQAAQRLHTGCRSADDTTGVAPGGTRDLHVHGRAAGHVPLRGGPHRRRRPPGGDGPRRRARRPAGRRHGVRRAAATRHGVRRRRPCVVLSEIDPALNAAPGHLRHARASSPTYRLINGKPFPATDPISTDQGHTRAAALRQRRVARRTR